MFHRHAQTKGSFSRTDQNPKGTKLKVYQVHTSSHECQVQERSRRISTSMSKIVSRNDVFQCDEHHRERKQKL